MLGGGSHLPNVPLGRETPARPWMNAACVSEAERWEGRKCLAAKFQGAPPLCLRPGPWGSPEAGAQAQ